VLDLFFVSHISYMMYVNILFQFPLLILKRICNFPFYTFSFHSVFLSLNFVHHWCWNPSLSSQTSFKQNRSWYLYAPYTYGHQAVCQMFYCPWYSGSIHLSPTPHHQILHFCLLYFHLSIWNSLISGGPFRGL